VVFGGFPTVQLREQVDFPVLPHTASVDTTRLTTAYLVEDKLASEELNASVGGWGPEDGNDLIQDTVPYSAATHTMDPNDSGMQALPTTLLSCQSRSLFCSAFA